MVTSEGVQAQPPEQIPPGWFPDETDPTRYRWWSGAEWTEYTRLKSELVPDRIQNEPPAPWQPRRIPGRSAFMQPTWFRVVIIVGLLVLVAAAVGLLAINVMNSRAASQRAVEERAAAEQAEADREAAEQQAAAELAALQRLIPTAATLCGLPAGVVQDGGASIFLDTAGNSSDSGDLSIEQAACVLHALDIPDAIRNQMNSTTAFSGVQSSSWGPFEATWSYNPSQGLDVIIKRTQ